MKYFTPERYVRLQDFSSEAVMAASEQDWQRAAARYQRHLERLFPNLPASFRTLVRKYYLHDAQVLSMGERDHEFVIVLRLETPPQQVLILTYQLTGPATIRTDALRLEHCTVHTDWLYDEIQRVLTADGSGTYWIHSILFSNGWEIRLPVRRLRVVPVQAIYPKPGATLIPAVAPVTRSA